jgi:hypothetical protein
MERFTVEETNLICIYISDSRTELIGEITGALPFMDEEMREAGVSRILCKLKIGTKQGKIYIWAEGRNPALRLNRIIAGNRRGVKGCCRAAVHFTLDAAAVFC